MKRFRMSILLVTLSSMLLLMSACGRDDVSRTCHKNTDCDEGGACIQGTCVVDDVDTGPQDDVIIEVGCQTDDDCEASGACFAQGNQCVAETCVLSDSSDASGGVCQMVPCAPECEGNEIADGCGCVALGCESALDCDDGYVCLDAVCGQCLTDDHCSEDGSLVCSPEGRCITPPECFSDDECPPQLECSDDHLCVDRRECVLDRDCGEGLMCLAGQCTLAPECTDNSQCGAFSECIGGICHLSLCRGPEDCASNEVCDAGECVIPAASKTCVIATQGGTIAQNQRIRLEAFAYDIDGNGLAANFVWASSNPGVASIDGGGRHLVGGTQTGTTTVSAGIAGGEPIQCTGPIDFTNLGVVETETLRIIVTNGENQSPVAGADVVVNNGTPVVTNATGVAIVPRPQGRYEVSVFTEDFNYITLQGIQAQDIRIPLSPRRGNGPVAGFTGKFNTTLLNTSGDITLGLAGASLAGGLIDLDLERLLGDPFMTSVDTPMGGGDFPMPGGLIVYGSVFGFQLDIKDTYYVNTSGGARLSWGLAGRVPLNQLIPLFTGGGGMADVLTQLLPLFSRFDHAAQPMILTELPRIVDTADINGNGDTTEWVPDYLNFPVQNLRPSVRQRLATEVNISAFPEINGEEAELAVLVGGTILDSPGLVPLGISATSDEDDDGRPDTRILYMAPPHGSATGGRFAVMALAFRMGSAGGNGFDLPRDFSAALWSGETLPTSLSLGTFPDSSTGNINNGQRRVDVAAYAGPIYRVRMVGADRSWDVWSMGPAGTAGEFAHSITIPQAPAGRQDLFSGSDIMLDAIRTAVSLDDLIRSTGVGLRNAGLVATSYNRTTLR